MPTYYLRPGTTLADGKLFVRGAIPQITQRPRIEYGSVLVPGVELTITRAQWPGGYAPVETLTLDGVDVIGDITDNGDGTWAYTAPTAGRLRYAAYPDNGAAYAGRVVVIEGVTVPVALGDLAIVIDGADWSITRETWLYADSVGIEVTLDGSPVGLTGTFTNTDDGKTLTATETATNAEGQAFAEVSQTYFANLEPPVNTSLPTITWDGNDWTVAPGTWTGADSVSTVVTLGGVTVGLTGTLIAADDGKTLLVTETATNEDGSTTVTVSDVAEYVVPSASLALTGSPTVTTFLRSGTDYTQIIWRSAGSFNISGTTLDGAQYALAGGGGSGGKDSLRGGGGGGAGGLVQAASMLAEGNYSLTIGAGGAGVGANLRGNAGASSSALKGGASWLNAAGGGYGAGRTAYPGGDGACGGGAQRINSTTQPGGVGSVGGNGGSSSGGSNQAGGGGGGMGGNGANGVDGDGGDGGIGITLSWTNAPIECCGGGGGAPDTGGSVGSASHGGTPGKNGNNSLNAINGGGSGGCGNGSGSGKGGDGFFVMVFPTANATIA